MNSRRCLCAVLLALICISCPSPADPLPPDYDYTTVVQRMVDLQKSAMRSFPPHFKKVPAKRTGVEFNPSRYFTILRHISIPKGYILDYVYASSWIGGQPHLYLRKWDEPRFEFYDDYAASFTSEEERRNTEQGLTSRFQTDGTPEGYFELAVFHLLAPRFYLWWHGGYGRLQPLTTRRQLMELVESLSGETPSISKALTPEQRQHCLATDVTPRLRFLDSGSVQVTLVTFNRWQGLERHTFHLRRTHPHTIKQVGEVIVQYDCGYRF